MSKLDSQILGMLGPDSDLTPRVILERLNAVRTESSRVTKRTVERCLANLEGIGVVLRRVSGRQTYWRLASNVFRRMVPISVSQFVAIAMARRHLDKYLPQDFISDLDHFLGYALSSSIDSMRHLPGLREWADSIALVDFGPPTLAPEFKPEVWRALQEAMLALRCLRLSHSSRGLAAQAAQEIRVEPVGIKVIAQQVYLVCRDLDQCMQLKQIPLHRINAIEVMTLTSQLGAEERSSALQGVSQSYFRDYGQIKLKMLLTSFYAAHIRESRLSEDQQLEDSIEPGWVLVTATVRDTDLLRWWLRGYGEQVEVLEPRRLRNLMKRALEQALDRYVR